MMYILGIDQGGSGTRALVCDQEGHLRGMGKSRGASHAFDGMEVAMSAVRQAAEEALSQAGIHRKDLDYIFAGMTGADWADEYLLLEKALQSSGLCDQVTVSNDCMIALRGGTEKPYGAILIAGTGGNVAVRAPDGREFIYGNYQEPDLQGGYALGRRALIAVFRSYTRREPETTLTERILEWYHLQEVDRLCRLYYEKKLPEMYALAPLIFDCAGQGDEVAARIVIDFARGYTEMAVAGLRRFEMCDLELEVVLSGSLFKSPGKLLKEPIAAGIKTAAPRARLVEARYEPVVGAALLGLENAGIKVDPLIQKNIETSAAKLSLIRHSV